MLDALSTGLGQVFSWPGILIPVAGTLLAMVVSFLPGIGSASLMAVMLVLTLSWEAESVLLLFGALTGGATFMGSITAILFNIPGGAPSAAVLLDGYPLGQKGYPKMAIACAATASAVGSIIGVVLLIALLPVIRTFLLEFGPLEYVLLGIWGLTTIVAVPNTPPLKSATMAMLGLLVAMVGSDPTTGEARWTFGFDGLQDGIGVIPALLGFFTLAEVIAWTQRYQVEASLHGKDAVRDSVREGVWSVFRHPGLTIRSSLIGTIVGIIPGVGGTVAGFVAYGQAVQTAKGDRSGFGKGDIRGVIAPEAAVDAKDGGSLLPAVAFGLPGSEAGVMLVTVLALHGLVPGTPMLTEQLPMTMTLIMALLFSNLLTSVAGVWAAPSLARLTTLRVDRLALPALVVSLIAVVHINGSLADLYVAAAFGVAGYFFKRHAWPRVPFVIAFVLGGFIEGNLALSIQLLEYDRVEPFQRPATLIILAMIVLSMIWMYGKTQFGQARAALTGEDTLIAGGIALVCVLFAGAALSGSGSYSLISWGVVILTFVLSMVSVLRGRAGPGVAGLHVPAAQRLAFWALLLLPWAIQAIGLSLALGSLVFLWLAVRGGWAARSTVHALTGATATGLGVFWMIHEVTHLILPRGWLWDSLAWVISP